MNTEPTLKRSDWSPDSLAQRAARLGKYARCRQALSFRRSTVSSHIINSARATINPALLESNGPLDSIIPRPSFSSVAVSEPSYELRLAIPPSTYYKQPSVPERYELRRTYELRGEDSIGRLVTGVALQRLPESNTLQIAPLGITNEVEAGNFAMQARDIDLLGSLADDAAHKSQYGREAILDPAQTLTITDSSIEAFTNGETIATPAMLQALGDVMTARSVAIGIQLDDSGIYMV